MFVYIQNLQENRFLQRNARVLSELSLQLSPLNRVSRSAFLQVHVSRIVVLNWIESALVDKSGKAKWTGFFKVTFRLLILRLLNIKLVWIRHNRWPHSTEFESRIIVSKWLRFLGHIVNRNVCLSKHISRLEGYFYLPHICYQDNVAEIKTINRDLVAVCLGTMHDYKGLDRIVSEWSLPIDLEVRGHCEKQQLENLRSKINVNPEPGRIKISVKHLSDQEFDEILLRSKYTLISHSLESAYVSGTIHHALSFGSIPIMYASDYREELISVGVPIVRYEHFEQDSGEISCSLEQYFANYGRESVKRAWREILSPWLSFEIDSATD